MEASIMETTSTKVNRMKNVHFDDVRPKAEHVDAIEKLCEALAANNLILIHGDNHIKIKTKEGRDIGTAHILV